MPFYSGDNKNVIPVYESSFQFQGYIAQAYEKLMQIDCDDYFFVADDMLLNPEISESYFRGLKENTNYIDYFIPLEDAKCWQRSKIQDIADCFPVAVQHTNYKKEMFSAEDAFFIAKSKGYDGFFVDWFDKYHDVSKTESLSFFTKKVIRIVLERRGNHRRHQINITNSLKHERLPYPLFMGYSDWLIVTKQELPKIARVFGVTAAMGMFVEVAIPTIMFLYSSSLGTIESLNYESGILNTYDEKAEPERRYSLCLNKLLEDFPAQKMYLHPIKLSKWKFED